MRRLISPRTAALVLAGCLVVGFGPLRLPNSRLSRVEATKRTPRPTSLPPQGSGAAAEAGFDFDNIPRVRVGTNCHVECVDDEEGEADLVCIYELQNLHPGMDLNITSIREGLCCGHDNNCDGDCDDAGSAHPVDANNDGDYCDLGDVPPPDKYFGPPIDANGDGDFDDLRLGDRPVRCKMTLLPHDPCPHPDSFFSGWFCPGYPLSCGAPGACAPPAECCGSSGPTELCCPPGPLMCLESQAVDLPVDIDGLCPVDCDLPRAHPSERPFGITRKFELRIRLITAFDGRQEIASPRASLEGPANSASVAFPSADAWCGRNGCCEADEECGGRNVCATCEFSLPGEQMSSSQGCCVVEKTCPPNVLCCADGTNCDTDGLACTVDTCADGCCAQRPLCVGTECCADEPTCTDDGQCDLCEDGDPCTVDRCVDGCCEHPAECSGPDFNPCEDGNPETNNDCTVDGCCNFPCSCCPTEECNDGLCGRDCSDNCPEFCGNDPSCAGGAPCLLCDDDDPRTLDTCRGIGNQCCESNCICEVCDDYCGPGSVPFPCSDDNPCTDEHCDGTCCLPSTPHCAAGVTCCADGTSCDDADPCTDDVCTNGCCVHTQHCPGGDCGDAQLCLPGVCCLDGITCNDGDACTDDSCGGEGCCTVVPHCPNDVLCCAGGADCNTDGLICTDDACSAHGCCEQEPHCPTNVTCCADDPTCAPGGICTSCDDGDPCTDDACGADGCCTHVQHCPGGDCDGGTICGPGVCCLDETICNDGDPCTDDTCGPEGCCVVGPHCPEVTGCCVDNEFCRTRGVCEEPECCADDGQCPYDACLVSSCVDGCCSYEPYCPEGVGCCLDGASCDDGDACTLDSCGVDGCCEHEPRCPPSNQPEAVECCLDDFVCDDGDECTDDLCNQHTGCCKHVLHCLDGAEDCPDDFDACTFAVCTPEGCCDTRPRCPEGISCCANDGMCDDGNPCTREKCMPTGCCKPVPACVDPRRDCIDDGDPCTIAFCTDDGCCDTRVRLCPQDFNLCTEEVCDSATGLCVSQPIVPAPAGCP